MTAALGKMTHRGPNAGHSVSGNGFCAGHRRLAIIDLAGSTQPMQDQSRRWTLVFNGEIYNYQELRRALSSRWVFQTHGDTEVVLAGLILEGGAFLKKAEGMWALALWDAGSATLLLTRDRLGKKPLYYEVSEQDHSFCCASELPALRCLTRQTWQEDEDSSADFFRFGLQLPGITAYRGVKELLPGHLLYWTPGHTPRTEPYWQLTPTTASLGQEDACTALRKELTGAVQKRLVADVEVGAFLSGGIDSSLIVGLMAQQGQSPKTFTIGFDDPSYDERIFARQIAELFKTDHQEKLLTHFTRENLEQLILSHVGQPFTDSSLLPTALVSQMAATSVKVVLSGDGGDELFSGYQRYQARAILRWYTRIPKQLRQGLHHSIRLLPEPMVHHSRSLLKKAHLFADVADRLGEETPYIAPIMFTRREMYDLCPDIATRGHPPPGLPVEAKSDDIARMMVADALVYMPQDILVKVDRASMAYGLEVRAPFLDHRVVELAFSMPRHWHRRGLAGKRMLRQAFTGLLPENLWQRRKQGFGVPINAWFRQSLGHDLRQLMYDTPGHPINPRFVEHLLARHIQGGRDYGYRLWAIYIYLLWHSSLCQGR